MFGTWPLPIRLLFVAECSLCDQPPGLPPDSRETTRPDLSKECLCELSTRRGKKALHNSKKIIQPMADLKTKIIRRLILQTGESLQVQWGNNASEQSLSMGVCRGTLLLQSPRKGLARRLCRHSQPAHGQVHAHGRDTGCFRSSSLWAEMPRLKCPIVVIIADLM